MQNRKHDKIQHEEAPFSIAALVVLTIAVSFGTFMEVLDSTIVNVSIPSIAGSLGASVSQGTLVISLYALASAIAIPLTGFLSTYFGPMKVFIASVLSFSVTSMLCGFSKSMEALCIFRFLQGFFSGPMVPLSQAILLHSYPPEKRGLGLAFFVITIIVAPIFGPILGGFITDSWGWQWLFYINVPVGITSAICMGFIRKGRTEPTKRPPIDYVGIILLFIGVGALQLMLDNGNDKDWFNSNLIIVLFIIAIIGIALLIIWELTDEHPAIDLTLYANYNYAVGTLCVAFGMFCFFGSVVIFPLWLQTVKGYTSSWAGLATAPIGIIPLFLSPIIGMLLPKLNLKLVVTIGFLVFSVTMFWYSTFNQDTPFTSIIIPRVIQGIGLSCFFLPLNQLCLSSVPKQQLVSATALFNFVRAITTSFATAVIVFLWQRKGSIAHSELASSVASYKDGTQSYIGSLDQLGMKGTTASTYINQVVTLQSTTLSTQYIFQLMGFIFLGLTITVWFAKNPKKISMGAKS